MAKQFKFTPQDHRPDQTLTLTIKASLFDKITEEAKDLTDDAGNSSTPEYLCLQALELVFTQKVKAEKPEIKRNPNERRGRPPKSHHVVAVA